MALFDKDVDLVVPETIALERFDPGDPSFQESRLAAITEGQQDFESVTDFITQLNEFNVQAQKGLQEAALPGFSELQAKLINQATTDITDPGSLSPGVRKLLETQAAQRGVTTGVSLREGAGQTALLRDFGLTALDLEDKRIRRSQNLFQQLVATSPNVSAVSPFAFLQTGGERAAEDVAQSRVEFEADRDFKIRSQEIQQQAANVAAAVQNQEALANRGTLLGDLTEVGLAAAGTAFQGVSAFRRPTSTTGTTAST